MEFNNEVVKALSYFTKENPKACDTAEGIARWWLKMPLEKVLPTLEGLVELGSFEKLERRDCVIYRAKVVSISISQTYL